MVIQQRNSVNATKYRYSNQHRLVLMNIGQQVPVLKDSMVLLAEKPVNIAYHFMMVPLLFRNPKQVKNVIISQKTWLTKPLNTYVPKNQYFLINLSLSISLPAHVMHRIMFRRIG